ncbi:MAG: hypothetical protein FWG48_04155 [Oscillospiraceae bacterium]|nr:hypothetical protein [Oscillospiraceae bacterium]
MSTITLEHRADDGSPYLLLRNSEYNTQRLIYIEALIDNKLLSSMPGSIEFRAEGPALMRIRGRGSAALRLRFDDMKMFENACPREDGSIEAAFMQTGKLLIVPLRGALWHNAMWLPAPAKTDDFILDLLPSVETLEFEAAIHAYYSNGVRNDTYRDFEEL